MKMPAIVPAGLCVVAGIVLLWSEFLSKSDPEAMGVGIGLYFVGKGLFIYSLLSAVSSFKQNR